MQTAPTTDYYKPVATGRNTPLVASYAHTTPLVPPVALATAAKPAPVTDVITNIKPAQPVVAATTTTTTTTATTQALPQQTIAATETRPSQVTDVVYPTAQSRTDATVVPAAAATATTAAVVSAPLVQQRTTQTTVAPAAAATQTAPIAVVPAAAVQSGKTDGVVVSAPLTQSTTTTTTAVPAAATAAALAPVAVAAASTQTRTTDAAVVPESRRGLDLDVGAAHVDSYAAPTPIHLTIHPDPTEEAAAGAEDVASSSNAIAYLHSVHPALPPNTSSSGLQQQQQPMQTHRSSEGAAAGLNGLWTPLGAQEQAVQQQSSSMPVQRDAGMAAGAAMGAAAASTAFRTELPTTATERVQRVDDVSGLAGNGRTSVPVAMAASGPLVMGQTEQMGGVDPRVTQVDQASGLTGERVAVASASQRAMPASQTFTSTTAPEVLLVPGFANASSSQPPIQSPASPAPIHGDQVYASEAPVIPARPLEGSVVKTNKHDQQYYDSHARVERDAGVAAGTGTEAERVQRVDDVSGLSGSGRIAVPVAMAAAGSLVMGETRQLGGVDPRISQVDQVSGLSGERVAVAAMSQHAMPASQTFTSTTGQAVVQMSDPTNLQGGFRTPVVVDAATAGPLVVGETHEIGSGEQLLEVDDVSRLGQAERVAVATVASQRQMPAAQTFTSTSGPQVVHIPQTYISATPPSVATGPMVTQPLEVETVPNVVQVDNTSSLTGERLDLAYRSATGPMVTTALAPSSQLESVMHVSHAAHVQGEPIMVNAAAGGPLYVGETRQVGATTNIMQVDQVRGERLPLGNASTQSTTGTMHTYQLAAESQPQIRYMDQVNQTTVQPVSNVQYQQPYVQNVQNVQQNVQTVRAVQQPAVVAAEQTTITREAVSSEEAAAQSTTQPLATTSEATYETAASTQSASAIQIEQSSGVQQINEEIGGRTHIMFVDKSRMEGREAVPVESASWKDKDGVDAMSGGVQGMQLSDKERQTYAKEEM